LKHVPIRHTPLHNRWSTHRDWCQLHLHHHRASRNTKQFFSTTLSYFSKRPHFQQKEYLDSRGWRTTFAVGVILGAFIYAITLSAEGFFTTSVQWWRLALGGFLVGFGTRLSKGMYLWTWYKWVRFPLYDFVVCSHNVSCCRNTDSDDCPRSGGDSLRIKHFFVFTGGYCSALG